MKQIYRRGGDLLRLTNCRSTILFIILPILFFFLISLPALNAEFILDAHYVVKQNPAIKDPTLIGKLFRESMFSAYKAAAYSQMNYFRPLVTLSFAANYAIGKLHPWVFRLTNLLLHMLNCLLVYIFSKKICGDKKIALLAANLFLFLPVQEWVINYIVGRGDLLQIFFSLLCLIFLILYHENKKNPGFSGISLICFIGALLSREVAILLPIFIFLTILFISRNWQSALRLTFPYLLVVVLYLGFRSSYFPIITDSSVLSFSIIDLVKWSLISLSYATRFILPWSILSEMPAFLKTVLLQLLLFISLGIYGYIFLKKRKASGHLKIFIFALFWIFLNLLFLILTRRGIIKIGPYLYEHNLYFASIGFCLGLAAVIRNFSEKTRIITVCIILSYYGSIVLANNLYWTTEKNLLTRVARKEQGQMTVAYQQLMMKYLDDIPKVQELVNTFHEPKEQSLWLKRLGYLYRKSGNYAQAIHDLKSAIARNPNNLEAYNLLAVCFLETGKTAEGVRWLNLSMQKDSENFDTYRLLGEVALRQKDFSQSVNYLQKALKYNPDSQLARSLLQEARKMQNLDK